MLRSLAVVLTVALLGASPPPAPAASPAPDAAAATDRVPELAGTWTCRKPSGYLSIVVYRAERNGITGVETGSNGTQVATTTFARDANGWWRVDRTTSSGRFTGYAPAWTTGAWLVADPRKHGPEIRYERLDDRTLKRTLSVQGHPPYNGDVCARGDAPPDAALCALADVPPTVLHAAEPSTPLAAMQNRVNGVVDVLVSLDAEGRVVDATVTRSPSPLVNDASIAAARQSRYQPALHDCKPAPSKYTFSVEYMAN
jgi:TonB family protein